MSKGKFLESTFFYYIKIMDKYNRNRTNITKVCKHKAKSAGKLPDGTKLVWMYYDEWLQLNDK